MKVLVIGAAGMVGRRLCERLLADGDLGGRAISALTAVDAARRSLMPAASLQDVPGGWDVSLGNVVLDDAGRPVCTAHGPLTESADVFVCAECGARATLG